MGKTHSASIRKEGPQEVLSKKSWRFATARLILLVAITAGLLILPSVARATDRMTDKEVDELLAKIETDRSTFEAALDTQLKNAVIKGARGEVDTNQFLDDLQDQVTRTRERFKSDYSASSEVIALLDYSTRLDRWTKTQSAGFKGSAEWGAFASDLQRLAAAYNTSMPMPAGGMARRYNDADLAKAAAEVEQQCDAFRHELDASLTASKASPDVHQNALQQVDMLKSDAHALNQALGSSQKGVAEADALIKQALVVGAMTSKVPMSSATSAAWTPLRISVGKVALAYEVNNRNLAIQ